MTHATLFGIPLVQRTHPRIRGAHNTMKTDLENLFTWSLIALVGSLSIYSCGRRRRYRRLPQVSESEDGTEYREPSNPK